MRNCIYELKKEHRTPAPLNIHIGVNTGLVVAGEVGGDVKKDFTVMGDTVNLAARLKDASPKGKIWVGPHTYRYTRGEFDFEPLPPLTLKNKARPVPAYEVLSVKGSPHRAGVTAGDRMVFSDLIGRERELEQIRTCIARVVAGQGGIVSLVGDAGLGKSRLVTEALASDEVRGARCLEGRSLSIGQNLSYHPFIDLLRRWARITDEDSEGQALQKLEASVAELLAEEAGEVFPFVATLMGMRLTGAQAERIAGIAGELENPLEKLILKSMKELLQAIARACPLVLVFEDVHWADASSVALLETFLRLVVDNL